MPLNDFANSTDHLVLQDTLINATALTNAEGAVFRLPVSESVAEAFREIGIFGGRFAEPSTSPPTDTTLIWQDKNSNPSVYRAFNPSNGTWEIADYNAIFGVSPGTSIFAVDDRAALKTSSSQYVLLLESGREGIFAFDGSDLSTQVSNDTQEGVYIAPTSDATGASGAWVRVFAGPIHIGWFGAAGDGVTNDAPAFNAASNFLVSTTIRGGEILLRPLRYLIDSDITLDEGVSLIGDHNIRAESGANNFNEWGYQLALNPAHTITMLDSSSLHGVVILNKNTPSNVRQDTKINYTTDAAAMLAVFSGTAITSAEQDVSITNCLIAGFVTAFDGDACHRLRMRDIAIDCLNGVDINATLDACRLENIHCFPHLTAGRANDNDERAFWERSGVAFNLSGGQNDGATIVNGFSFCWNQGFIVNGSSVAKIINCWADYFPELGDTDSIGFHVLNAARGTELIACHASSVGRGLVANTSDTVNLVGWESWAIQGAAHIDHIDGHLLTSTSQMDLFSASSSVIGYRVGAGIEAATLVAPKFDGFTNPFNINAAALSSVEIVAPQYEGGLNSIPSQMKDISLLPSGPDEGGELSLQPGTSFTGTVSIDRFQNDARIFFNDALDHRLLLQNFGAGSLELSVQGGVTIGSYTAANIADASNAINTTNKAEGKIIRDSTNSRLMVSSGSAATSPWHVADGSASVTPV